MSNTTKILTVDNCYECPFSHRPIDSYDSFRMTPIRDQVYGAYRDNMTVHEKVDTRMRCKKFNIVVEGYDKAVSPECKLKNEE